MDRSLKLSRWAGFVYLIVVITGIISLAYVPSQLIDMRNPTATFDNLVKDELLFRIGLVASIVCYLAFIFLPLLLYKLFHAIDERNAKVMVLLALLSSPMSFLNLHHKYVVLNLIVDYKYKFKPLNNDIYNTMLDHLNSYQNGLFVITLFWGLWLLPFGYLAVKSNFFPKILGYMLMLGCLGYVVGFFGTTLSFAYSSTVFAKIFRLLPTVGEISICFWLLLIGARKRNFNYNTMKA